MSRSGRRRLRTLREEVARAHPHLDDPDGEIRRGNVVVDGLVATNPATLIREGASVALRATHALRGEAKLRAALDAFGVDVRSRVAVDVGAAAGGFTRVLLERGAQRVYAVDAGHGQLLGSLRADPRVVNLEATNLGNLDRTFVPDEVEVVTIDVSYLPLTTAVPQLEALSLAALADAVALVKPQFELRLAGPPTGSGRLAQAVSRAREAFRTHGWEVQGVIESPVRGSRGAVEFLLHARRRRGPDARPPRLTA